MIGRAGESDAKAMAVRGLHVVTFPGKNPVVLLHGFGESASSQWFEPGWFSALQSSGIGVTAFDWPGHGVNAGVCEPNRFSSESLCCDVAQLLADAVEPPVTLIGHSLGARIALEFALREPAQIKALVLCGVGRNVFERFDGTALATVLERASRSETVTAAWQPFIDSLVSQRANLAALGAFALAGRRCFDRTELARIFVPTLLLAGEYDRVIGTAEPLADALPQSELVYVRGADHASLTRSPGAIEAALGFLRARIR